MHKKIMFVVTIGMVISMLLGGLGAAIAEPSFDPESIPIQADPSIPITPEMLGQENPPPRRVREGDWPGSDLSREARAIHPVTDIFPIANTSAWEHYPSIAHGIDLYMVVFIRDGVLWGSIYNYLGNFVRTFVIDSFHPELGNPSVAFSRSTGWFVVTYHSIIPGSDKTDIWVATVKPEGPSAHLMVYHGYGYLNPDIACVNPGFTCLIVFETDKNVSGFYVVIRESDGLMTPDPVQEFSNLHGERPKIALGKWPHGMVTFTWTDDAGYETPMYNAVSAMPQPIAPVGDARPVRDFSGFPWDGTYKSAEGITYDPCAEKYMILFDHYYSPTEVVDVWGAAIGASAPFDNYWSGYFAYDWAQQLGRGISFVAAEGFFPICGWLHKLVVVYAHLNDNAFYAVEVTGNNDIENPNYSFNQYSSDHFLVADLSFPNFVSGQVVISGGDYRGHMFIAYTEMVWEPFYSNVFGRFIHLWAFDMPRRIFIPLVINQK